MATKSLLVTPTAWFTVKTSDVERQSKVFLNICTDDCIPEPPKRTDDTLNAVSTAAAETGEIGDYYLPIILSNLRDDQDKSGKQCQVVDCILNPIVRRLAERMTKYRNMILEIVLDTADSQFSWNLSREIVFPNNMRSKGKLMPRQVTIPTSSSPILITPEFQEITEGGYYRMEIDVPKLDKNSYQRTMLDVEEMRVLLKSDSLYELDVIIDVKNGKGIAIDEASAKWHKNMGKIIIRAPLLA
ncbi:hypothetical protein FRC19_003535 [Serendipita sp. 401]|nr:hypothetical protein FRC19_003535 [Serendipita sp. 401]KAG9057885.1 hypothetical protein FS842_003205 [Serendipita sp. 407]